MNIAIVFTILLSLGSVSGLSYTDAPVNSYLNTALAAAPETAEVFTLSQPVESHEVWLTAYSSTPEETDDTPFITATGNTVRDGIVATNFLPFGTRVQIPEVFGNKIFVVDDRMHPRKKDYMDVWMPTKQDALNLGIRRTKIVVLASPADSPLARLTQ